MKKIISLLMGLALACQLAVPSFAQAATAAATPTPPTTEGTTPTEGTTTTDGTTPATTDGTTPATTDGTTPATTDGTTPATTDGTTPATTDGTTPATTAQQASPLPVINSDSYIMMNAATGQVLISKNPDKKQYPGNITKLLTAAIAMEYVDPEADYTVTIEDVFPSYPEKYRFSNGTYVAITQDEVVKVRDLICASLIQGADDAANALADCAAKLANRSLSLEDGTASYTAGFVEMMNEKTKEIGCVNSNFVNPHGLYNENQYTTAYDMALILRYALSSTTFSQYFGLTSYTMEPTNKQSLPRNWGRTKVAMMDSTSKSYYQGTLGVKYGVNTDGTNTSVALVERNGIRLICVAMGCTGNAETIQNDMVNLFNYCYDNFNPVTYTAEELSKEGYKTAVYDTRGEGSKQIGNATYSTDSDFTVLVHKNFTKDDVYISTDIPGRYFYDEPMPATLTFSMSDPDASQYMVPDMAALRLKVNVLTYDEIAAQKQKARQELFQKILRIVKIVFFVILGLLVLLLIIRTHNRRKYKKRIARQKAAARRRQQQAGSMPPRNPQRRPPQNPRNRR